MVQKPFEAVKEDTARAMEAVPNGPVASGPVTAQRGAVTGGVAALTAQPTISCCDSAERGGGVLWGG